MLCRFTSSVVVSTLIRWILWRDCFGYWSFNSLHFSILVRSIDAVIVNFTLHIMYMDNSFDALRDKINKTSVAVYLQCEKQSAIMLMHSKSSASGMRRISLISMGFTFPKSMNCMVAKPSWTTSTHSTRYHRPFVYFITQTSLFLGNRFFLDKI